MIPIGGAIRFQIPIGIIIFLIEHNQNSNWNRRIPTGNDITPIDEFQK
jgi:hypothetical protein